MNKCGTLLLQPNSGSRAIGKTSVASKKSKTTTGWWLISNWNSTISTPLAIKCQINNQKSKAQDKTGSPWKNWSLPTAWQLHFFAPEQWWLPTTSLHDGSACSATCVTGKTRVAPKTCPRFPGSFHRNIVNSPSMCQNII